MSCMRIHVLVRRSIARVVLWRPIIIAHAASLRLAQVLLAVTLALDAVDWRVQRVLVAICASALSSTLAWGLYSSAIAHARGPLVGSD